jgi:hypothetical protein
MAELVTTYADVPLGTADAADAAVVAVVAERLSISEVATLDHRHFHAVRPGTQRPSRSCRELGLRVQEGVVAAHPWRLASALLTSDPVQRATTSVSASAEVNEPQAALLSRTDESRPIDLNPRLDRT